MLVLGGETQTNEEQFRNRAEDGLVVSKGEELMRS